MLLSTSIIGGSSVVSVAIGIFRTKVLAVLLGPSGIGLIGIYSAIMTTASTIASMGLSNSATRQIATSLSDGERQTFADARYALRRLTMLLGVCGGGALALFSPAVSRMTLGDTSHSKPVAVLGVGVAATVIAGSQVALLTGMRRIQDVARVSVFGAALATIVAIGLVAVFADKGILLLVVSIPCTTLVVASVIAIKAFDRAIPKPTSEWRRQAREMLRVGSAVMAGGFTSAGTMLVVKSLLVQRLGLDANGQFQAAWAISMIYIGFVLATMGTDYYPRLSAAMARPREATDVVNDQTEIALLIGGPIVLAMTAVTPTLIAVFYSSQFDPATPVLRWQLLGNVLKLASWPFAFVFLARGASLLFFVAELSWNVIFILCVTLGLNRYGLVAAGVGFFLGYVVHIVAFPILCRRMIGFRWRSGILRLLLVTFGLTAGVVAAHGVLPLASQVLGLSAAILLGIYNGRRLLVSSELSVNDLVNRVKAIVRTRR
jgi:PST family polysaccharide transporter